MTILDSIGRSHSKLWATLLAISIFSISKISGKEITAKVVNQSGEAIENVSVITNVDGVATQTGAAGTFSLDISDAVTRITLSHVGYIHRQLNVNEIPATVMLERKYYEWEKIVVTADRARPGISPIAFDNYSQDDIKRDFTVADPPTLLNSSPNF
ncbi:MAG: hypothetical protein ACREBV_01715 [Candidatus Zixiibacteriota bacterium]